jgi:hypothetical protein
MIDLARAEYDALPEPIRMLYTYTQYQWLSDDEKARLIEVETEPEQYDE